MPVGGKLSDRIKDQPTYQKFLSDYARLTREVAEWEKEQTELHRQILGAIDQKKMSKILSKIKDIKDN